MKHDHLKVTKQTLRPRKGETHVARAGIKRGARNAGRTNNPLTAKFPRSKKNIRGLS